MPVVSGGTTALLVAGALGVGVWIGVKVTKNAVESGAVNAGDKVIRAIGGDPASGYGHVAHTLFDTFASKVLDNG